MVKYTDLIKFNDVSREIIGLSDELKVQFLLESFNKKHKTQILVTNSLYEANIFYRRFKGYTEDVYLFPMDDFLTSEALAISPELKLNRLNVLNNSFDNCPKIIITNLMGYLRFLPSPTIYNNNIISISLNKEYNLKQLVKKLLDIGYFRESIVTKTGDMAVRGYVLDVFSTQTDNPVRIEFWGDTIDSIREFNIDSQRTVRNLNSFTIYPNNESLSTKGLLENHRNLFYEKDTTNLTGYFSSSDIYINNLDQINISYTELLEEMKTYRLNEKIDSNVFFMFDLDKLIIPSIKLFYDFSQEKKLQADYNIKTIKPFSKNIDKLSAELNSYMKKNKLMIISFKNRYKVNNFLDRVQNTNFVFTTLSELLDNKINLVVSPINEGYELDNLILITENELFGYNFLEERSIKYKNNLKIGSLVKNISKLDIGDYIVHQKHGIGRYCGLKTLTKNGLKKDYIMLEYKGGDKLYIPVEKIDAITKYSTKEGSIPKLNKLGGTEWQKIKLRARKKAQDIAGDLLKLYATREATKGYAFEKDTAEQLDFEREFNYQPTADQLKVTQEIKVDMEKPMPMDRLLCGDVGFGKTEVAFRAMFKAVMSGKQVAMLCPTTILSNQHYQNAINRFQSYPINIVLLNRFVSKTKINKIVKEIKNGIIDIVIGTHRVLSSDIIFKDLGLLVIDEEQRFGVKHKEKIKQMKNNIDVLTLSATPIPRTLQMSMTGIRNLSLIETPPVNKYPIQTYVVAENDQLIKDAIYKELSRSGQVFILNNRIDDMDFQIKRINKLIPEARVISAHGQMNKSELENVMNKFINYEYDILICTTIIETGIDIPNVNTLIIIDADHFGLSQLYQIRGRVGRGNNIAYCYLMYDKRKILSDIATKRLNVIKDFTELGSGFAIAMRDLSIRGAGDILGSEQAGYIDSVGIDTFLKMLDEEIKKAKGIKINEISVDDTQPLVDVQTSVDDSYVSDENLKIEIHKRINQIDNLETLENIKDELEDRFGKLDENLIIYMHEELFETLASELKINKIRQTKNFIEIILPLEISKNINIGDLFMETSYMTKMIRFSMRGKLVVLTLDIIKLDKHFIYYLIQILELIKKHIRH
ncbi:MAG: transcription-repair coupling factor [Bacilli bacterium]